MGKLSLFVFLALGIGLCSGESTLDKLENLLKKELQNENESIGKRSENCPKPDYPHCGRYPDIICTNPALSQMAKDCPFKCGLCNVAFEEKCAGKGNDYCQNRGKLTDSCSCRCKTGYEGERCEKLKPADCSVADPTYCGIIFTKSYCTDEKYQIECPKMCGRCDAPQKKELQNENKSIEKRSEYQFDCSKPDHPECKNIPWFVCIELAEFVTGDCPTRCGHCNGTQKKELQNENESIEKRSKICVKPDPSFCDGFKSMASMCKGRQPGMLNFPCDYCPMTFGDCIAPQTLELPICAKPDEAICTGRNRCVFNNYAESCPLTCGNCAVGT